MLSEKEILELLKNSNALLSGHFVLTSGLHSPLYIEKFRLLEQPKITEILCTEIAEHFREKKITDVIGPMTGGIIIAYEVAKQLGVKFCFTERVDGKMKLKRGFQLLQDDNVLIVEDIITTGSSVLEVIKEIEKFKSTIVGLGYLVDRSNGNAKFPFPSKPLIKLDVINYKPDECPLCKSGIPLVKPGSTNK